MKGIFKQALILLVIIILLVLPYFVFAQVTEPLQRLANVASGDQGPYQPYTDINASYMVGIVISAFFSLLGLIFVILMLYAGYNWMTAAGDEKKVDKAKDTLRRAIVGIIITVGSYAIWNFVLANFIATK